MEKKQSLRVLISPLDWGLGHTTRCIPLIKAFLKQNCDIYVACNTTAKQVLQPELPGIHFLPLRGYHVTYASSKRNFALKMLAQIPKILLAMRYENRWLRKAAKTYGFDLIVSDNRYGLYHHHIPSLFITHQLAIQTPFAFATRILQQLNYRRIKQFQQCWVPDFAGDLNLGGKLSHPEVLPSSQLQYIGPLSRFEKLKGEIRYKWMMVVSGPEPQRTLLEKKLLAAIPQLRGRKLLIRGLPATNTSLKEMPHNCEVYNHLSTADMSAAFAQSEFIISRAGYTTVMEMMALQKKSVLIPTPGQTEQEYLAKHLYAQSWCYSCEQDDKLENRIAAAETFSYKLPSMPQTDLENVVRETIDRIRK